MVSVDTELVLSLSTSHAPGVFEVLGLILPVQAQVHDDLRDDDVTLWHDVDKDHLFGAIVKDAEVGLVVLVKAVCSVVINTSQSVHQLPEIFLIFELYKKSNLQDSPTTSHKLISHLLGLRSVLRWSKGSISSFFSSVLKSKPKKLRLVLFIFIKILTGTSHPTPVWKWLGPGPCYLWPPWGGLCSWPRCVCCTCYSTRWKKKLLKMEILIL